MGREKGSIGGKRRKFLKHLGAVYMFFLASSLVGRVSARFITGFNWMEHMVVETALTQDPLEADVDVGTSTTFTGTLTEIGTGNPIPNLVIHLFRNGVDTGISSKTDAFGNFSISKHSDTVGDYTYELRFDTTS